MAMIDDKPLPMKAKPGRILVQEDEFQYAGRIAIPEAAKRRPTTGVIVDIGKGINTDDFQVGEKIVYGLYSGTVVNFRGHKPFRFLTPDEVLGEITTTDQLEGVGT